MLRAQDKAILNRLQALIRGEELALDAGLEFQDFFMQQAAERCRLCLDRIKPKQITAPEPCSFCHETRAHHPGCPNRIRDE
jgi:hypothetical protein